MVCTGLFNIHTVIIYIHNIIIMYTRAKLAILHISNAKSSFDCVNVVLAILLFMYSKQGNTGFKVDVELIIDRVNYDTCIAVGMIIKHVYFVIFNESLAIALPYDLQFIDVYMYIH